MTWSIPQRPETVIEAVLFDLDGVLTPTADVHMAAWREMFTAYFTAAGITPEYTDADYFEYVDGKPRYDGVAACLASRGVELPWGDPSDPPGDQSICALGNRKNDAFSEILERDGVEPYAGSLALLDHLVPLDVKVAVVSSSRNAPVVLAAAGLADRFEVVVDGSVAAAEGLEGKPAPDMFELAAARLGVADSSCLIVEDALSGVAAGAAGDFALVAGVDRGAGAAALLAGGAEVVVEDLAELVAA